MMSVLAMLQQPRKTTHPKDDLSNPKNYDCIVRILLGVFLIAVRSLPLAAHDNPKVGYVYCSSSDEQRFPILAYSSTASLIPVDNLECGEKIYVLGRGGPWLKIATSHGDRYIAINAISARRDRFVALNIPIPSESTERPKIGRVPPQVTATTQPEYTQAARDFGIHGYVYLKLTIDVGGNVHDVELLRGLGYGLDESAVRAVQLWKFEPALQDGVPIAFKAAVEVSFPPPDSGPPHATVRGVEPSSK